MDGRVAHDAPLADLLAPGLELRLDEEDEEGIGCGQAYGCGGDYVEADEGDVGGCQVCQGSRITYILEVVGGWQGLEVADVGLLHYDDAGVGAQLPGKLV